MDVLDATSLAQRLKWEAKEYWVHLEAESPLDKYPAKQHARRVQEKLGVEEGLIHLPGQKSKNNDDSDMPAPFRQSRYFYYLSGCNEPDCHLTYDIQHDTLALFIPRIDEKRVIWNGRGSTLAEALVRYDVDEVYYSDETAEYIEDWYHRSCNKGKLFILHDTQRKQLDGSRPVTIDSTSLQPAMNVARMIKDEHEIELIQRANDISSKAHRAVLSNILNFKNEAQVEGLFLDVCVSHQAKQQAYDPIAASGPNAGTLHYDANNEDFEDRQLMCLDAACEYKLYASDITRTFPLSASWPSTEAHNIYKLVERMQEACISRLAPGVRYLDLHILAHQIAIDGLLTLGILHNGTREEIYKAGTSRAFFPHGLGHHVGLEVHDVGQAELMSIRRGKRILEQPPSLYPVNFHHPIYDPKTCLAPTDPESSQLEEGMVLTVEPGIYFSVYALQHFYLPSPVHSKYINLDVLQRYIPVGGVRIEDNLLITSKGYENLTTAPKGDEMLEIIRQGKSTARPTPSPKPSSRLQTTEEEAPRLCAPGISAITPESILRPIARAVTMPAEYKQRKSVDFEPFEGPSLFSNFNKSMTTDERVQCWQQARNVSSRSRKTSERPSSHNTMCGSHESGVTHFYMVLGSKHASSRPAGGSPKGLLPCKKCNILCEALNRLRKNLALSEQGSPVQSVKICSMAARECENKYKKFCTLAHLPHPLTERDEPVARNNTVSSQQIQSGANEYSRRIQPPTAPTSQDVYAQNLGEDSKRASVRKHRSVPVMSMHELAQNLPGATSSHRRQLHEPTIDIETKTSTLLPSSTKTRRDELDSRLAEVLDRDNRSKNPYQNHLQQEADAAATRCAPKSSPSFHSIQAVRGRHTLIDLRSRRQNRLTLQPNSQQALHNVLMQHQEKSAIRPRSRDFNTGSRDTPPIATATNEVRTDVSKSNAPMLGQLQHQMEQLEAQIKTYMISARGARPPFPEEARRTEE